SHHRALLSFPTRRSSDLAAVEAGYLVRDRLAADEGDMAALVESLRARGQQVPIEVVEIGPGRYGLISGWRRLTAIARLGPETGEERFAPLLALLRRPEPADHAHPATVGGEQVRE